MWFLCFFPDSFDFSTLIILLINLFSFVFPSAKLHETLAVYSFSICCEVRKIAPFRSESNPSAGYTGMSQGFRFPSQSCGACSSHGAPKLMFKLMLNP